MVFFSDCQALLDPGDNLEPKHLELRGEMFNNPRMAGWAPIVRVLLTVEAAFTNLHTRSLPATAYSSRHCQTMAILKDGALMYVDGGLASAMIGRQSV